MQKAGGNIKGEIDTEYNRGNYRLEADRVPQIVVGKAEEKAFKENQIREIKKEFLENFKGTPAFLEFDTFENILKSSDKENLKEWKRLLWLCANLYNALPYRTQKSVYLAVFAAAVTGNPHAFDNGTADGNFLYQIANFQISKVHRHKTKGNEYISICFDNSATCGFDQI